jgi:hypothetical protein
MQRGLWIGAVSGLLVGGVVATLLHNYPKDVVTRHRFCHQCAAYEETYSEGVILGGRTDHKVDMTGPIAQLLREPVGEHEHRYSEWTTIFPTFGVPPEHPELARRVADLRALEGQPYVMSGLAQAMRADEARTVKLLQRLLAPDGPGTLVLQPLQHPGTIEENLAKVEAKLAEAK